MNLGEVCSDLVEVSQFSGADALSSTGKPINIIGRNNAVRAGG
jgi:hypothetical protein